MPRGYVDGVTSFAGTPPFQQGDKVVLTKWYYSVRRSENYLVRSVIKVRESSVPRSGWAVSVDGGPACPTCGLTPGNPLNGFSSGWFRHATPEEIANNRREEFPPDPEED